MFLTSKRSEAVKIPRVISYDKINIETVENFKLLGVTIDNKLTFKAHVAETCLKINKKLYSIRKIFYLSYEVKAQFLKTFILPHFDYCLSLIVYFSKEAIKKLMKMYYICIYKLLNIEIINLSNIEINEKLKAINLLSFHSRCTIKIFSFIFRIKANVNAPMFLENQLKFNTKFKHSYNLRQTSMETVTPVRAKTKFGDFLFKNVFGRIINKSNLKSTDFIKNNTKIFKNLILKNLEQFSKILNETIKNLNVHCTFLKI